VVCPFSVSVKLTEAASPYRCVTSSGLGSGSLISRPGLPAVIGLADTARTGAGCGTVPGALQDTVTSRAGSAPQVSSSCSGLVVVGSGTVVVGGPLGGPAAAARGARTTVPPSAAAALTPAVPMMNLRRVNPALPSGPPGLDSVTRRT
jgi:hypothetical protein